MNICIYGRDFLPLMGKYLEKDGHKIVFDKISKDADLVISQSIKDMYLIYRNLKLIKNRKIKLINFILDVPPYRMEFNSNLNPKYVSHTLFKQQRDQNSTLRYTQQYLFNFTHKNPFLFNIVKDLGPKDKNPKFLNSILKYTHNLFNTEARNRITYLINYRNYLKKADMNLSISKYTQKCVKKFLKLETEVCHQCVDSDLLLNMPKPSKIEYDAVNIGRIVERKRQQVFVEAAKKLGLKFVVIGVHEDKWINLDCDHFYVQGSQDLMKELNKAAIFVDPSIFEGFGMPPVEAAFLNKITIVSDVYIHKEILRNYPLYFKANNVSDLVDKMNMVRNGEYSLNKVAAEWIKKEYSIETAKNRLLSYIESIL